MNDKNEIYPDVIRHSSGAKVLVIGYYTKFLVPGYMIPQFVEMLNNIQMVEGSGSTETLKPIEFEIKTPHEDLGRVITAREAELAKTAEENSTKWYKEYSKANQLEKDLKEAQAKIATLIERGVCGVVKDDLESGDL